MLEIQSEIVHLNSPLTEGFDDSISPLHIKSMGYNVAICTYCHIGLPFDWIVGHMKHNHGLKYTDERLLESLNISESTMIANEVQTWLKEHRVIHDAIDGIPILKGVGCSLCSYVAKKATVIYNQISEEHRNDVVGAKVVERTIQKVFQGRFKQYIQVDMNTENLDDDLPDWKQRLKEDFNRMMSKLSKTNPYSVIDGGIARQFLFISFEVQFLFLLFSFRPFRNDTYFHFCLSNHLFVPFYFPDASPLTRFQCPFLPSIHPFNRH